MHRLTISIRLIARFLMAASLLLAFLGALTSPAAAADDPGAVYTLSNAPSGNEVLVYERGADGSLSFQGAYATGGLGSGAGLGSQGALALSADGQRLFAVNPGSHQVSIFDVHPAGLELVEVVDSGGSNPISLTNSGKYLYVLNAGGAGNIAGFLIAPDGTLSPLAGSTQPLSNDGVGPAPGPAQVSFSPDGRTLVVTEKATNLIDTYPVEDGVAGAPMTHPSSGATPFGFAFDRQGTLIVSEAFGGQPGLSALSSYKVNGSEFEPVSPSVPTTQTAACWVVVSKNGQFAYTTNAGSGSISSYQIGQDGTLTLLDPTAALNGAGSTPIDMAFSNNGAFLYTLNAGAHSISIARMGADGSLASMGTASLPAGAVGLAAR